MRDRKTVLTAQWCPTLCDPKDCSPPGSYVHGILQARILEYVAIPFSRGSSQLRDQTSCIAGRFYSSWATWKIRNYYYCFKPLHSGGALLHSHSSRNTHIYTYQTQITQKRIQLQQIKVFFFLLQSVSPSRRVFSEPDFKNIFLVMVFIVSKMKHRYFAH